MCYGTGGGCSTAGIPAPSSPIPTFQAYAQAFGVRSWRIADAGALREAVREALPANAACLIEVMTDITREPSPLHFISPHRG